jgi:hypothetical protein
MVLHEIALPGVKRSRYAGKTLARLGGVAALACVLLVVIYPGFAPGLHHMMSPMPMR